MDTFRSIYIPAEIFDNMPEIFDYEVVQKALFVSKDWKQYCEPHRENAVIQYISNKIGFVDATGSFDYLSLGKADIRETDLNIIKIGGVINRSLYLDKKYIYYHRTIEIVFDDDIFTNTEYTRENVKRQVNTFGFLYELIHKFTHTLYTHYLLIKYCLIIERNNHPAGLMQMRSNRDAMFKKIPVLREQIACIMYSMYNWNSDYNLCLDRVMELLNELERTMLVNNVVNRVFRNIRRQNPL
jgi:hypothetical protein